jgi:hypothetical protein
MCRITTAYPAWSIFRGVLIRFVTSPLRTPDPASDNRGIANSARTGAILSGRVTVVSEGTESTKSSGFRIVAASYIGSVVAWLDFFIYGVAAASVFNVLFFPNEAAGVVLFSRSQLWGSAPDWQTCAISKFEYTNAKSITGRLDTCSMDNETLF